MKEKFIKKQDMSITVASNLGYIFFIQLLNLNNYIRYYEDGF